MLNRAVWIAALTVLASAAGARAAEGFGIGLILGEPTGLSIKKWIGPERAIDAAAAWSLAEHERFQFHADYLVHKSTGCGPASIQDSCRSTSASADESSWPATATTTTDTTTITTATRPGSACACPSASPTWPRRSRWSSSSRSCRCWTWSRTRTSTSREPSASATTSGRGACSNGMHGAARSGPRSARQAARLGRPARGARPGTGGRRQEHDMRIDDRAEQRSARKAPGSFQRDPSPRAGRDAILRLPALRRRGPPRRDTARERGADQ